VKFFVRARTKNFTWDDRVRVLVTASRESYVDPATGRADEGVTFFDATGREELYPPADNPLVLTVGDTDPVSAVGPTADHRLKPDTLIEDSRAFFTDGEVTVGSSNAAAYLAGVVALLKAAEPGLQPRHLLRLAQETAPQAAQAVPTRALTSVQDHGMLPGQSGIPLARSQPAVDSTPQPAAQPRVMFVGPFGRTRVILVPRTAPSADPAGSPSPTSRGFSASGREMLPPPRPGEAPPESASRLGGRIWHTPSRSHLAEVVRTDR
jgi:hypothetical protein